MLNIIQRWIEEYDYNEFSTKNAGCVLDIPLYGRPVFCHFCTLPNDMCAFSILMEDWKEQMIVIDIVRCTRESIRSHVEEMWIANRCKTCLCQSKTDCCAQCEAHLLPIDSECSICLHPNTVKRIKLPCTHEFHVHCFRGIVNPIKNVFDVNCPNCRMMHKFLDAMAQERITKSDYYVEH